MKIWVTGANGMLGRSIGRLLDHNHCSWVATDQELNIADAQQVRTFLELNQPACVINCAAYTAVDAAESDSKAAFEVNANGPGVLADACRASRAALIHFSTDYVFGGHGNKPYSETAQIAPINVYGASKAEGERRIAEIFAVGDFDDAPSWWILRTSWLFGDGPSSFVETMWKLMKTKDELRVVDDQIGRPTYVLDLAAAALRLAGITDPSTRAPSGIWHFANSGETSWHGLACSIRQGMLELGEPVLVRTIWPVPTSEFPRPASRPAYSVLSTERLEREVQMVPRAWQLALQEYLQQRVMSAKTTNEGY